MATSFVEWTGLTKLIEDLRETIPQNASAGIAILTTNLGEHMLELYRNNLSGGSPSTADAPLPVGMQSGDLYEGAQLQIVNQYSFSLYNDTEWAGWIEDGTSKMAPRRPLQDAVDQIESEMDVTLDEVMTGIIE